jgi:threonine/homoserine/homoserine lactone efflux protein
MTWHVWLAFAAASAVIGLIPGPGVTAIVGYALNAGRRTALASVAGMAVGNATAMTLSLAGVGALLAASALAFSIVKWIGAFYLIALGVVTIRKSGKAFHGPERKAAITPFAAFAGNVAVGTFHPKTILFFVAFVPQFVSAQSAYLPQAALLVATFCLVVGATDSAYALTAAGASRWLRQPGALRWPQRAGGGFLIAAGVATAAVRR